VGYLGTKQEFYEVNQGNPSSATLLVEEDLLGCYLMFGCYQLALNLRRKRLRREVNDVSQAAKSVAFSVVGNKEFTLKICDSEMLAELLIGQG